MSSVLLNGIGNGCLTSLRKTRLSEVSSFVKSYNNAQTRSMRKEVDKWYKDTRHTLRNLSENQHKLYGSLLKLSKEKKAIKICREDEAMQNRISRENYLRRKEQLSRRRQLAKQDSTESPAVNILILDHGGDQKGLNDEPSDQSNTRAIVDEPIVEEDEESSNKSSCNDQNLVRGEKRLVSDLLEVSERSVPVDMRSDFQIWDHPSANLPSTHTKLLGRKLTNSHLTTPKLVPHLSYGDSTKYPNLASSKFADGEEKSYDALLPEIGADAKSNGDNMGRGQNATVSTSPCLIDVEGRNASEDKGITRESAGKFTKRYRYKRNKISRPDPTEQLNSNSSIQAMQGKTYEVFSYRRDSRGSLREEGKTVDTTIDVSQYFNFNYYRNRQVRHRMLENSRSVEQKQNKRVAEFLMKLDQDRESFRLQAQMKAKQMENERLEIQKREANIIKKPPRYGLQREYTATPGYVRKYKRRSGSRRNSRDKRKSSWYLPSLYTLNMKTSQHQLSPDSGKACPTAATQQNDFAVSGHLVNINLEKYVRREDFKQSVLRQTPQIRS